MQTSKFFLDLHPKLSKLPKEYLPAEIHENTLTEFQDRSLLSHMVVDYSQHLHDLYFTTISPLFSKEVKQKILMIIKRKNRIIYRG